MKFNWGHGITLFLALFVIASGAFIVFSFKQKNDLVTKDYYKLGADYSSQMIINQRSMPFIDSVGLTVGKHAIKISFPATVADRLDSVRLNFFRPSDKELDYNCILPLNNQEASMGLENLTKGRYLVRIEWKFEEEPYQVRKEVFIK